MLRSYRVFSTASAPHYRRVLCSLDDLKKRNGKAIKFPLTASTEPSTDATKRPQTARAVRGGRTGFVFFCENSQAPRAFVNSCPHALLELDLDDSDFFCDGFVQCKAHGAFFDPYTGICLQGPAASRRGRLDKQLGALRELSVHVEGAEVVLLPLPASPQPQLSRSEQDWRDYRTARQQELAAALALRQDDLQRMQATIDAKTMARLQQYATKPLTKTTTTPPQKKEKREEEA